MVAVREVGEKYSCAVCGNEVEVTKAGGGELVCCGQPMQLITEEAVSAPEPAVPEEGAEAPAETPAESEESAPEEPAPSDEERPQTF